MDKEVWLVRFFIWLAEKSYFLFLLTLCVSFAGALTLATFLLFDVVLPFVLYLYDEVTPYAAFGFMVFLILFTFTLMGYFGSLTDSYSRSKND